MTTLSEVEGLTAADVMHERMTTLPASATVAELREYFATSGSRRVALLVDGERYAGAVEPAAIPDDAEAGAVARDYATAGPTIGPDAPAKAARDLALAHPSLRLPVIDEGGRLVGIVAINHTRDGFCGT